MLVNWIMFLSRGLFVTWGRGGAAKRIPNTIYSDISGVTNVCKNGKLSSNKIDFSWNNDTQNLKQIRPLFFLLKV